MPLIKDGAFIADEWCALAEGESLDGGSGKVVVPFSAAAELNIPADAQIGLNVPNNTEPDALAEWFARASLIVIPFPGFNDGRGFSLAKRLRRLGYKEELRAKGHVIPDQYAYAVACGFDTVEISDDLAKRQPEPQWRDAFTAMTVGYQAGYSGPQNILEARRAGTLRAGSE